MSLHAFLIEEWNDLVCSGMDEGYKACLVWFPFVIYEGVLLQMIDDILHRPTLLIKECGSHDLVNRQALVVCTSELLKEEVVNVVGVMFLGVKQLGQILNEVIVEDVLVLYLISSGINHPAEYKW